MLRNLSSFAILALLCLGCTPADAAEVSSGSDDGYVFVTPPVIEKHDVFRNGKTHDVNHAYGFFVSENPQSPFFRASFYTQGTMITDPDGTELGEVALMSAVTPDGSASWFYANSLYEEGPVEFYFANGSGRWHGITGGGTFDPPDRRTDGGKTVNWRVKWEADPSRPQTISGPPNEGPFPNTSTGLSFHGLHLTEETLDLGNGLALLRNNQSGKVWMDDPDDPFHMTDGYYQGDTIKDVSGEGHVAMFSVQDLRADRVWSDVGIKSYVRADGDSLWIVHSWWYHEGLGHYRVIGGTGQWKGIRGRGRIIRGAPKRVDNNWPTRFEFVWTLVE